MSDTYRGSTSDMVVDLAAGADDRGGTLTDIEGVIGTDGDDQLIGTTGAESFSGLGGDDAFRGRAGADLFRGGGGAGDDSLTANNRANVLIGGLGADSLCGLGGTDLLNAADGVADLAIDCGDGVDQAPLLDAGIDPTPLSC